VELVHDSSMRVSVGDVRLFFDIEGAHLVAQSDAMEARLSLLLLHGGPGADHTFFKPEFSAMADAAQVVYLDQRGSGRSDRGDREKWTWDQWADDIAGFCEAVDIDKPVLVGTSSGGMVALLCAIRHPGLVAGLVLDSTLGVPTTLEETLAVFERRGGVAARDAASSYFGGDTSPATISAWQEHCLPLYGNEEEMQRRRARADINDEVHEHFRQGRCGPTDISSMADTITCPTLILAGADDPVSPSAAAQRLADSLVNSSVETAILAGVGHGVFRQAPQQAFALLRAFLHRSTP
jgi:pimeloyl-ACP methyl ester carboxylesterase